MKKDCALWRARFIFVRLLTVMILLSLGFCLFDSDFSEEEEYEDEAYVIRDYQINIKVSRESVFHIEESYRVEFFEARHGIYRNIKIAREKEDGSRMLYKVENVDVEGDVWNGYENDGLYNIQIGDQDKTVSGVQNYKITYDLLMEKDTIEGYDEAFFDLTGKYWNGDINKLTYRITFEDYEWLKSKKWELDGAFDEQKTENGSFILWGEKENLLSGEKFQMSFDLPEGYFKSGWQFSSDFEFMYGFMVWVALAAIPFVVYHCMIVRKFEKYRNYPCGITRPPENLDSLHAGIVLNEELESRHVFSMFFWFLDHGNIGARLSKYASDIEYAGISEPGDKCDKYLPLVYSTYMPDDKSIYQKHLAEMISLNFAETVKKLRRLVWGRLKIYAFEPVQYMLLSVIFVAFYQALGKMGAVYISAFSLLQLTIPAIILVWGVYRCFTTYSDAKLFGRQGSWNFFFLPVYIVMSFYVLHFSRAGSMDTVMSLILPVIVVFLLPYSKVLKREYIPMKIYLEDFARFIRQAKPEVISLLMDEDPDYYFHVLPYACAFDLDREWTEKCRPFLTTPPAWVPEGKELFDWDRWIREMEDIKNQSYEDAEQERKREENTLSGRFLYGFGGGLWGNDSSGGGGGSSGGGSW